jgi:hypothetical protein
MRKKSLDALVAFTTRGECCYDADTTHHARILQRVYPGVVGLHAVDALNHIYSFFRHAQQAMENSDVAHGSLDGV